jgi:hypothetical protein
MTDDDGAPYKVWAFFRDGTHYLIADGLGTEAAVECAKRQTQTVGARLGTTKRIIIEDCGGFTSFEWQFKKGVTYPKLGASRA